MHNGNYIVQMFSANCKVEIVEWKLQSENAQWKLHNGMHMQFNL